MIYDYPCDYSFKANQLNCYTVEITDINKEKFYGIIKKFLLIDSQMFALISLLETTDPESNSNKYSLDGLSSPASIHLQKYFILVNKTNEIIAVKTEFISNRCILIKCLDTIILTPCVSTEHD